MPNEPDQPQPRHRATESSMLGGVIHSLPSRERWLEERRLGIGGSDVPAILGLSNYATPLSVWASKCGHEPDDDSTYSMRRGLHMEAFIAEELEASVDGLSSDAWLVSSKAEAPGERRFMLARRRDEPRLAYSPDGCLRDPDNVTVLGEWKSQLRAEKNWRESVPLDVQAQVQHGMYVLDLPACYVAVDLGNEMRWDRVERDPHYGETVVPALLRWWSRFVETETPPPATGADADGAVLAFLFPESYGGSVTLPISFDTMAADLDEKKAALKALTSEVQDIQNQIKQAIGDQERGVLSDGSGFTWRDQKRKGYTVAATEFRVLRRTKAR